jgi:hypothetical protein
MKRLKEKHCKIGRKLSRKSFARDSKLFLGLKIIKEIPRSKNFFNFNFLLNFSNFPTFDRHTL